MGAEPTTPTRSHAGIPPTPSSTPRSTQTHQLSPAPTLVESSPPPPPRTDKVAAAFDIQEHLVRQRDPDISFPSFAIIGGESAGKSSAINGLLKVELFSSSGTATRGPTFINSRHRRDELFEATLEIELDTPEDGCPKCMPFTSAPIRSRDELRLALKLAGDEARRVGSGSLTARQVRCDDQPAHAARTFEVLKEMSDEGREVGKPDWDNYTANTVRLIISGPKQVDMSICDLPGLTKDNAFLKGLAEKYIRKDECTVLLCVPTGLMDFATIDPAFKLVQQCRPTGEGVMGLFTMADMLDPEADNPFCQHILGEGRLITVDTFKPQHGWFPLRTRTRKELPLTDEEFNVIQRKLFEDGDWQALQRQAGRDFGLLPTTKRIIELNRAAIERKFESLHGSLLRLSFETAQQLAKLPPKEIHAVAKTHQLIDELAHKLRISLTVNGSDANKQSQPQKELFGKLEAIIPEFHPWFKKDAEGRQYQELRVPGIWLRKRGHEAEILYFDDVLNKIQEMTLIRNLKCDNDMVEQSLARNCPDKWRKICEVHIQESFDETQRLSERAVDEVCGGRKLLSAKMKTILRQLEQSHRQKLIVKVYEIVELERTGPWQLDFRLQADADHVDRVFEHLRHQFHATYGSISSEDSTTPPATDQGRLPHPEMTKKERKRTLTAMTEVTVATVRGATRLDNIVGRLTQACVLEYLSAVSAALRKGLELENLPDASRKRIGSWHEPSSEIVAKRNKLAKQQKFIEDLQAKLNPAETNTIEEGQ